ncbi:Uncharacterised protein [Mycobacteroides abscessus subsp. massiliense]|nr:Uncharacterised protein [Mycobacteroides abscessus subsp. massiliense]
MDIGSRRVHAHTATAINKLVVGIDGEARAAQATEQRIARAAAFADDAHIRHGLQKVCPVTGREGLQSSFGVESNAVGFFLLCAGDGDRGKGNCFFRYRISVCPCLRYG